LLHIISFKNNLPIIISGNRVFRIIFVQEMFEDTKGAIRRHKLKDRQYITIFRTG